MSVLSFPASRRIFSLISVASLLTVGLAACKSPVPLDTTPMDVEVEKVAIRQALHTHVDGTPGAQPIDLEVAQVGVDSGYALVTWTHDKEAGQAVLRKQGGAWEVLECGEGWLGLRGVCRAKVPEKVAQRLLDQIDPRWGSYEKP